MFGIGNKGVVIKRNHSKLIQFLKKFNFPLGYSGSTVGERIENASVAPAEMACLSKRHFSLDIPNYFQSKSKWHRTNW